MRLSQKKFQVLHHMNQAHAYICERQNTFLLPALCIKRHMPIIKLCKKELFLTEIQNCCYSPAIWVVGLLPSRPFLAGNYKQHVKSHPQLFS